MTFDILLIAAAYFAVVLALVLVVFYTERKFAAFVQDRLGPMEVGKYGVLQPIADLLKLLQKEDIIPAKADRILFMIAPLLIFPAIFAGFSVVPLWPGFQASAMEVGVFFLLAIISLDVLGLLMAGWASNSKFSLLGAMRAVAQIISYEIPLGLCVLCVAMLSQSLDLQEIALQQGIYSDSPNYLFGIRAWNIDISAVGGILSWNIVRMPLFFIVYVVFYITSLAECNRAPFDIPEGESEIIGGFHTEYSGFRFAAFFLAEYSMMVLVAFVGVILFLGAWNTPLPNLGTFALADWTSGTPGTLYGTLTGLFWIILKTVLVTSLQVIMRWTYPRLRVDQLMYLCWKVLTPLMLLMLVITGLWRMLMLDF